MPSNQIAWLSSRWMNMRPQTTLPKPDTANEPHPGNDGMTEVNRMRVIPERINAEASSKVSDVAVSAGLTTAKIPAAPYRIALRATRPTPYQQQTRNVVARCTNAPNSIRMPTVYTDTVLAGGRLRNASMPKTMSAAPGT